MIFSRRQIDDPLTDLLVVTQGSVPVELVSRIKWRNRNRTELHANVDPLTGRVDFFVPLNQLDRLRR